MSMETSRVHVFTGCKIITMDDKRTIGNAIAVQDDKIISVGSENDIEKMVRDYRESTGCKVVHHPQDGNRCIMPGFIDTHLHPGLCIYFKLQVNLSGVRSQEELKKVLQEAASTRKGDEWILGVDLMEDNFVDPAERFFPTRKELDLAGDNPIVVMRHDGHICSVNTAALQHMNITDKILEKFSDGSGEIRMNAFGEFTGVLTEEATSIALNHVPFPGIAKVKDAGNAFSKELASFGITTAGGMVQLGNEGIAGKAGAIEVPLMIALASEGIFNQDFVFYLVTSKPKKIPRQARAFKKLNKPDGQFTVGGIKLYADGSFGASTACMHEPFSDSKDGVSGFMVKDIDTLRALFKDVDELGFQVAIHAIGDKANRLVVDAFDGIATPAKRHRIEHASILTDDTMADIARLGLVVSCQPAFIHSEHHWLEKRLGKERLQRTYAFKSMLDAGIMIGGASDAPVESANVMRAIEACVTRDGMVLAECIPVMDALAFFTIDAARVLRQEGWKGSLEPGKQADFVILEKDPTATPSSEIGKIKVLATYHRGKCTFRQ
ncbi:amidohydrolase family protein [Candidatus Bathyarchaeota archaeon]|nr:amidohydrolase family protein [Candidatus Bathyarchaeota archaeon]